MLNDVIAEESVSFDINEESPPMAHRIVSDLLKEISIIG